MIHQVKITNADGTVDVYETDGINKPTKNGVPFEPLPPQRKVLLPKLPTTIRWSKPIKKDNP